MKGKGRDLEKGRSEGNKQNKAGEIDAYEEDLSNPYLEIKEHSQPALTFRPTHVRIMLAGSIKHFDGTG